RLDRQVQRLRAAPRAGGLSQRPEGRAPLAPPTRMHSMTGGERRPREHLSAAEARRVVLTAQGFSDRLRERRADGWALRHVLARVGLLQMDSVNAVARAHYLPPFARMG